MQRIYLPNLPGPEYAITDRTDGERYHQFTRVLRVKVGESFRVFTDWVGDSVYEITYIDKDQVLAKLTGEILLPSDELLTVHLYQALPNRLDKIEYLLQKWCEVGISKFVFFSSHRSNTPAWLDRKIARLQEILIEATEQSYGLCIPEIELLHTLPPIRSGALVTHTEDIGVPLSGIQRSSEYDLWVGPEGGWSDGEISLFKSGGAQFVHFGPRVLRTETAGVVGGFWLRN